MKIYRLSHVDYGSEELIFQGGGAALYPGRWNVVDSKTIYASSSIDGVISEKAFAVFGPSVEDYNRMKSTKGFPRYYFDILLEKKFKLAVVILHCSEHLIDLTNEVILKECLREAGLEDTKTIEEYRKSSYQIDPWMRDLADYLYQKGALGIKVYSARTDVGYNIVLFEDNLEEDSWEIEEIIDLNISAVSDGKNDKLRLGQRASEKYFMYETIRSQGIVEIRDC